MANGSVVVFDTNVLIPLLIPASLSTRLFVRLQAAGWPVATSPQLLDEVRDKLLTKPKLRTWLGITADDQAHHFVDQLAVICDVVAGHRQAHGAVPADPDDDMVIAAALEAGASYLISEDRDLLDLGSYQGIQIISRQQFADELDRLGVEQGHG